jgi:folate-binding protein YgfZ
MGAEAWQQARVLNGLPALGAELTELYNPLEAGLYHAVSLAKGCYVGQETISKVHITKGTSRLCHVCQCKQGCLCYCTLPCTAVTREPCSLHCQDGIAMFAARCCADCGRTTVHMHARRYRTFAGDRCHLSCSGEQRYTGAGVKQQLWGLRLRLGATCAPQDAVMSSGGQQGKKIGIVTSVVVQDGTAFALAYLKCKRRGQQVEVEGTQVYVNGEPAKARSALLLLLARHFTKLCVCVCVGYFRLRNAKRSQTKTPNPQTVKPYLCTCCGREFDEGFLWCLVHSALLMSMACSRQCSPRASFSFRVRLPEHLLCSPSRCENLDAEVVALSIACNTDSTLNWTLLAS